MQSKPVPVVPPTAKSASNLLELDEIDTSGVKAPPPRNLLELDELELDLEFEPHEPTSLMTPAKVWAAEKAEQEQRAREAAAKAEQQERLAREAAAKAEQQERLAREAAAKAEQEQLAREVQEENDEWERIALEAEEKAEQERLAREAAEKAEQERLAREAAEKAEQERLAREAAEKAEQERLAREAAEKAEQERLAREAANPPDTLRPPSLDDDDQPPVSSRQPRNDFRVDEDDAFADFGVEDQEEEPPPASRKVASQRMPDLYPGVTELGSWPAEPDAGEDRLRPADAAAAKAAVDVRIVVEVRPASLGSFTPVTIDLSADKVRRSPVLGDAVHFIAEVDTFRPESFGELLDASLSLGGGG